MPEEITRAYPPEYANAAAHGWEPGSRVGAYRVLRTLGEGAFGVTLLAERGGPRGSAFKKLVALKVMRTELADDEELCLRMCAEAALQAGLRHDQIVDVYDFHRVGQQYVLELEFVDGCTLAHYLTLYGDSPLPAGRAGFFAYRLLCAAACIHDARDERTDALRLVHRDIKPANVFLGRSGAVKLGDFGLIAGRGRQFETRTGPDAPIMGTPRYMAPEQCAGLKASAKADVYAIGVVLYEMLTGGRHPANIAREDDDFRAIAATLKPTRTALRHHQPALPTELAALVDGMVATLSEQRPTAADALRAVLALWPFDAAREEQALAVALQRIGRQEQRAKALSHAADAPTECAPKRSSAAEADGAAAQAPRRAPGRDAAAPVVGAARNRQALAVAAPRIAGWQRLRAAVRSVVRALRKSSGGNAS